MEHRLKSILRLKNYGRFCQGDPRTISGDQTIENCRSDDFSGETENKCIGGIWTKKEKSQV